MILKLKPKGIERKKITNYIHTHTHIYTVSFIQWILRAAVATPWFRHKETTCLIQRPDPQGVKTIDFLGPESWRIIK